MPKVKIVNPITRRMPPNTAGFCSSRGLRDIFVACIDGLSGFAEAIHAAYPETISVILRRFRQ
ncbi:MAG: hypothetical protein ABIK89_03235 [Planctomycetota bacterium]